MSGHVAEHLLLQLKPGEGALFAGTMRELAAIVEAAPGTSASYWARYGEDGDFIDVVAVWDSIESHMAFTAKPDNTAPITALMGPHLAAAPKLHDVAFSIPEFTTLLEGGVVQMVTVYGVSTDLIARNAAAIVAALQGCATCRGVEWGDVVQETKLEDGDESGKAVTVAVGWEGPVGDVKEEKRGLEWWSEQAAKMAPGAKVEMHEVVFEKLF